MVGELSLKPFVMIPNFGVALVTPTDKMKLQLFTKFQEWVPEAKFMEVKSRIELKEGYIHFWSSESVDNMRGNEYHLVIGDEAAYFKNLKYVTEVALGCLRKPQFQVEYYFSTPDGFNDFYDLENEILADPDGAVFHKPSHTNPFLPPAYINGMRSRMSEMMFRQEAMAEYVALETNLINASSLQKIDPREMPKFEASAVGLDLAISKGKNADLRCLVAAKRGKDGNVYVIDCEYGIWGFNETLSRTINFARRHKAEVVVVEATGYQEAMVDELIRTTELYIKSVHPSSNKVVRAYPMVAKIEKGYMYFSSELPDEYFRELCAFPNITKKDKVDATVMAVNELFYEEPQVWTI